MRLFRGRDHGWCRAMSRLEATAAAAAVTYIDRPSGKAPAVAAVARGARHHHGDGSCDPRNLELTRTLAGERRGSAGCDRLHGDSAGSRLLAQRLAAPLTDSAAMRGGSMRSAPSSRIATLRDEIRTALRAAPDMSRALARLSVGRGGPRDLAGLRDGILAADRRWRSSEKLGQPPQDIAAVMAALRRPSRSWRANSSARWPNSCR